MMMLIIFDNAIIINKSKLDIKINIDINININMEKGEQTNRQIYK